ncbi:MAG: hypothetical protein CFE21_22375 [Bacteroidetes bacterium B1(2017)]|nr:MAG: hypothetical protein CFE21_22375 [Bacteroidetes bacterium B1(2017)]
MRESKKHIEIDIPILNEKLSLTIYEEYNNTLFLINEDEAITNGEAVVQLLEGRSYEYKLSNENFRLSTTVKGIISISNRDNSSGRITPNIYVGTLFLFVQDKNKQFQETKISIEVLATKMNSELDKSYRENYRFMLDSITEKCTELLMQINAPINQYYEIDFEKDNKTIYQRFAFVQSLIGSNEFKEAIQKIISSPTTQWKQDEELKDIRSLRRITNSNIRQLVSASNRFELPPKHFLTKNFKIKDVPSKISSTRKVETIDTPENRFIKHAVEAFLKFSTDCFNLFANFEYERAKKEAAVLISNLENHLNHPFFREISRPITLKLNSPVLQRKSGYREILSAWLKFDLAAKLIWQGGEDVYNAGKRDIAVLYEYWLFFTLYDLIKEKFKINQHQYNEKPYEHLIVPTNDGLNIMVKSGKHTALEGVYDSGNRKLQIKFSYNRTFTGGTEYINKDDKKSAGSWTKTLRPDYTLSIWPADLKEISAEEKELIVHIHFDSKYKVDQYVIMPGIDSNLSEEKIKEVVEKELNEEKEEERKGKYKNADLLKMHAYKDAIRRTGGAYILYPGTENQKPLKGFHEIIPGLGAFAIRPSAENTGITELSKFVDSVINHLLDRASQREFTAVKSYEIHKKKKKEYLDDDVTPNILREPMPEYFDTEKNEKIIPDETFVLVGYCKNNLNIDWYKKEGKYNFRMDDDKGSLILENKVVNAKYLLLRESGKDNANRVFKIKSKGPKVIQGSVLEKQGYKSDKLKEYYLVIEIENKESEDFGIANYNFKELARYKEIPENKYKKPAIPFAVTLTELMKVKNKE